MERLSWQTHEYIHAEKTVDWYWIVGIVTISMAIIAVILNNIIFAILIIVSSFTLSLFAAKKPRVLDVTIDRGGITTGKTYYPYTTLDTFWVETGERYPKILLKSKKVFMPLIAILIEDVEPETVRELLSQYLSEEEHSEHFLEKLLAHLGF